MSAAEKHLRNFLDIHREAVGEEVTLSYEKLLRLLTGYGKRQQKKFELLLEDIISNCETSELIKELYREKLSSLA